MSNGYVVAPGKTVWHSKENKYFTEGQTIDLSHLSTAQQAAVLASGAVRLAHADEAPFAEKKKSDGKDKFPPVNSQGDSNDRQV